MRRVVYQFRSFRNADPPHLAAIWNSQPPSRGIAQPINPQLLELCVFSRQFFDPAGMIIAEREGVPIGFAHAAFGPDETGARVDTSLGSTQVLMLRSDVTDEAVADELIARSEAYQKSRGATVHYAGGIRPLDAFYLGMYGGSELPGLLDSTPHQAERFIRNGYDPAGRVIVLHRELARFRSAGARDVRVVRRETDLEQTYLPPAKSWWEACVTCGHDRIRFALRHRAEKREIASVTYWDIEPLASAWGIPTVGLVDLYVDPSHRRHKVATHLLNESLRVVQRRGASIVEAQVMAENTNALALYDSLGFTPIDSGAIYRRHAD
ncbi:GNAT family N-acetyltransferase [Botrimarina hoheduenensis]|uniref:Putative acetyltransferase n=1 Tax=Botrimarina hoheduenensis TaxID=2528000 RepID=A0A5C5VQM2_9BACT|nr:GNAT family N-acetyltransferase [Botrimarina hoheduenensis]TWT40245.1 putative acetyltransferase [Botrimarina hoheduenensis]